MRKLTYFFIALFILLIILLAATPWLFGYQFKKDYLTLIDNINNKNKIKIVVLEYHLGWLSSTAKLKISPSHSELPADQNNNIILDQQINHGPYLNNPMQENITFAFASVQSYLHAPEIEKKLLNIQDEKGLMQIYSLISFNFHANNQISTPVYNLNLPNIGNATWQGVTGTINFYVTNNMMINIINSNLKIGAFNFSLMIGDTSQVAIGPSTLISSETFFNGNQLTSSESAISIPNLMIKRSSGDISVNQFDAKRTFSMNGNDFYQASSQFSINKIEIANFFTQYIAPIKFSIAVEKLNAKGIDTLISKITPVDIAPNIMFMLPQIFTPTSSVTINASANTPLGGAYIDGNAHLTNNMPLPQTILDIQSNLLATANIKVAIPLVNAFIDQYAGLAPLGMPSIKQQPANTEETNKNPLNETVAMFLEKGMLELPISLQIMQLGSQDKTLEAFAADIDKLNLPPQVSGPLKEQFKLQLALSQAVETKTPQLSSADIAKALIAAWVSSGLITQDSENYSTTIMFDGGRITANGKEIQ